MVEKPNDKQWLDAQIGVLGSVLIEPQLAPKVIAETRESDYRAEFRAVYGAIAGLLRDGQPVDVITVRNRLGEAYSELLMEIMKVTPTAAHIEAYISACKEQARLSQLHGIAWQLCSAVTLDEARELLSKAQDATVEHTGKNIYTMADAMASFYAIHQGGKKEYIDWGFGAFDDKLSTEKGDVVVLAGRPSDGKSAIMLQFAYHMAQKYRVGIFSFETLQPKLTDRLVSHVSKIQFPKVKQGDLRLEDWQRFNSCAPTISSRNMEFIEAAGMTVNDILGITLARRYEVIFIDYVQQITPMVHRGGTRNDEVAGISKALATMARQHKVMVVELSQLSRPQKTRAGSYQPPAMSDLRESGQLEQDADVIMMLYRTNPESPDSPREMYVAKNKEGTLGKFTLLLDGKTQTFYRPTRAEIDRIAKKAKRENEDQTRFSEMEEAGKDLPF